MSAVVAAHSRHGSTTAVVVAGVYGALWASTAAGGALAELGVELTAGTPRDALPARLHVAAELFTHNALVALWPLVIAALGWPAIPIARAVADAAITGHLLGHGLLVGNALASHPDLWRYLPHLPVEWLALALPAAAWITARRSEDVAPLFTTSLTALVLAAAALLETYAVPI